MQKTFFVSSYVRLAQKFVRTNAYMVSENILLEKQNFMLISNRQKNCTKVDAKKLSTEQWRKCVIFQFFITAWKGFQFITFVAFFSYFLNDFEISVQFNISYEMKTNVTNKDIKIGQKINNTRTNRILNLVKILQIFFLIFLRWIRRQQLEKIKNVFFES